MTDHLRAGDVIIGDGARRSVQTGRGYVLRRLSAACS